VTLRVAAHALSLALIVLSAGTAARAQVPTQGYEVVRELPHDREAFTEGLFIQDGRLFESTGQFPSSIREVRLETGEVLRRHDLSRRYFGEGVVAVGDRLFSLTWQDQTGFIWNLDDFAPLGRFTYPGEGWALTTDGQRLIMSDGTPELRFLDPATLEETGRVTVTADGVPEDELHELEWVDGDVLANIWQSNRVVRIDPETGRVKAFIDLSELAARSIDASMDPLDDVLNGIAWDAEARKLYVTGKRWPTLFEIRLTPLP
jgi:glutamine cyclotransferase